MVIEFFSYKMTFVQPIGNDRIWWIFGSFFSFHWGLIQWKNKNKDNSNNNNLLLSIWSTSDCLLPVVVDNNEERSAFIFFVCIFRFDLIFFCFVSHFKYEPVAICLFVDVFFFCKHIQQQQQQQSISMIMIMVTVNENRKKIAEDCVCLCTRKKKFQNLKSKRENHIYNQRRKKNEICQTFFFSSSFYFYFLYSHYMDYVNVVVIA